MNGQQPTDNWKGYTIVKTRDVRSTKSNIIKDSKKEIKKNDSKKRKVKEESLSENEAKEEEKPIIENPIRDES